MSVVKPFPFCTPFHNATAAACTCLLAMSHLWILHLFCTAINILQLVDFNLWTSFLGPKTWSFLAYSHRHYDWIIQDEHYASFV